SEEEKLPKCRTATLCPKKRSRRCRAGDWAARSQGQVAAAAWVEVVSAVAATATFIDQTTVIQLIGCPRLIVEIGRLFVSRSVQCHGIDLCRHKHDIF